MFTHQDLELEVQSCGVTFLRCPTRNSFHAVIIPGFSWTWKDHPSSSRPAAFALFTFGGVAIHSDGRKARFFTDLREATNFVLESFLL